MFISVLGIGSREFKFWGLGFLKLGLKCFKIRVSVFCLESRSLVRYWGFESGVFKFWF